MATYHCSVQILSRSHNRSAVQFSAYISGEKIYDERSGRTFDHTTKEEVWSDGMVFSERIPEEYRDQKKFWNEVERIENRENSQVARIWEIALPHELTKEQNEQLLIEYVNSLIDEGMPAVQYAIHLKDGNWHIHLMAPTRDFQNGEWQIKEKKITALDEQGKKIPRLDEEEVASWEAEHGRNFDYQIEPDEELKKVQKYRERKGKGRERLWQQKTISANPWNGREPIKVWRKRAADLINKALEKAGHSVRVDHRSFKDQGKKEIPQIHEGYAAQKMEKDGKISERSQLNREIRDYNLLLQEFHNGVQEIETISKAIQILDAKINYILSLDKKEKEEKATFRDLPLQERRPVINQLIKECEQFFKDEISGFSQKFMHYLKINEIKTNNGNADLFGNESYDLLKGWLESKKLPSDFSNPQPKGKGSPKIETRTTGVQK